MIENEEADIHSAETTWRIGTEAEEEEYGLERRVSPEDEKMNQKLKRLKEQLLAELGKQDQNQTSLPTSSPFSKWMQQETVPKKFMMPSMAVYDGAECAFNEEKGGSSSEISRKGGEREPSQEFNWKLYVDGASGAEGSGAGIMLKGPEDFKVCYALRLEFKASNNAAEYEALINGMLVALEVGVTDLEIKSDSQLVINQVTGAYQARDPIMQNYLAKVKTLEAELTSRGVTIRFQRIPREENEEADLLS
ncbi:uncharacterized protein LOC122724841 [Manihot esculenta]|uniref:uncharacterized protein LOC122724841 n=1 Tax=Manihot esculenta TaxID=3983 RepID=UPI001CC45D01|nr:uncharacterized protein LOC122724841 [Manihot esculenta]